MSAQDLKKEQTHINILQALCATLKGEVMLKQSEYVQKKAELSRAQEAYAKQNVSPRVSEHAMLRYFERKLGFDLKEIEKKILTPEVIKYMEEFGDGQFPNGDDILLVVKNKTVTTIL